MLNIRRLIILALISLSTACVATSYSRGWMSKNNVTTSVKHPTEHQTIKGTRALPPFGKGYRTYSWLGSALGRQYAHHKVILTLETAFAELHELTGQTFDIAEIGDHDGGKFHPHQTHKHGLSVDIMTPMMIGSKSARLTTDPLSLYGYCWHIDDDTHHLNGRKWDVLPGNKYPKIMNWLCPTIPWKSDKEVDFSTLKLMIETITKHAELQGGRVKYVFVDPSFRAKLQVQVPLKVANIDHDDHIHVEFGF